MEILGVYDCFVRSSKCRTESGRKVRVEDRKGKYVEDGILFEEP